MRRPEDLPGGPVLTLPLVDDLTAPFWHGGREGHLVILRCQDCGWYIHPPRPVCPKCLSRDVASEPVSGRGTVHSVTVNHQPWYPGQLVPYAIAIVELDEQPGLRLTTNILDVAPEDVAIEMPVEVEFVEVEDVFLPVFRPFGAGS